MDDATESYIMLLLADGNLPTGSFVASSGLESYVKHGFFGTSLSSSNSNGISTPAPPSAARSNQGVTDFIKDSLQAYAHSALPFVSDAHLAIADLCSNLSAGIVDSEAHSNALSRLTALDDLYHSMNLNDVTRRASKAQGVALLTLFTKGFSRPQMLVSDNASESQTALNESLTRLVDAFKLRVRREELCGHLPICWGVLTAALGLSLERSQYLHLFLQARALLSASIRLNTLGPYAAQQILLHVVKGVVEQQIQDCRNLRTGLQDFNGKVIDDLQCSATTWPLGEILAARHDLQHSRIFNS